MKDHPILLSNEEAAKLLALPKKIVKDARLQDNIIVHFGARIKERFLIHSIDGGIPFLLEVKQGLQHTKITLHFQENSGCVGLLRVDYNSAAHKNPMESNTSVPAFALPYIGKVVEESHVHFHVHGYKTLAWAVPIPVYGFKVASVENADDFHSALLAFCDAIQLKTTVQVGGRLFL